MARVKSKSNVGVYKEVLDNGDTSFYYTYKDIDGKKRWVKVGLKSNGYSERDAVVQRRKTMIALEDLEEPLYIKKNKFQEIITLNQLATYYFNEKSDMKNHRDAYLKYMHQISPVFGLDNILTLRAEKIQRFKQKLIEKGYRAASVNYYLAQLKAIINYAVFTDRINIVNPCSKVKLLALNNQRKRILSENEIELLLKSLLHKQKAYLFVLIAIFTGARPKAILNLQCKNIDFSFNKITFIAMKNRPSYSVAIHSRLREALQQWVEYLNPEEYLFYRENPMLDKSSHMSYIGIKKQTQPTMDLLFNQGLQVNDRINKVTLYTLRHSFGSLLSKRGANAFVIKELMNHSKIDTTDRYVKVTNQEAKKYIDAIL